MQDDNFKEWGSGGEHYCEIGGDMKDKHLARELAVGWAKQVRRVPAPRGKRRISLHAKPFTAHCAPHVVCFCAGSLFRWDTKTIHTGWLAGSRLAQAVALALASWRAESERAARLRLTALGFPSTHWARVGMQHDMVLDDGGIFGAQDKAEQGDEEQRGLPLKVSLWPYGLVGDAPLEKLRELAKVDFSLCGTCGDLQRSRRASM